MPCGVRWTLVFKANCSARPIPAAPPCAPTRPPHCMSGFWIRQMLQVVIPRHALDEKRFTKTKSRRSTGQQPRTKSASRPADEPLRNRLSTAGFVPAFGLHRISLVRASGETFRRRLFDAWGGTRDACLLGVLFCRRPVLLGSAPPPRRAPRPDPPVVCPGFGFDRWVPDPIPACHVSVVPSPNVLIHGLNFIDGIPKHASHEKGLQRQKAVGPLYSSQEEKRFSPR